MGIAETTLPSGPSPRSQQISAQYHRHTLDQNLRLRNTPETLSKHPVIRIVKALDITLLLPHPRQPMILANMPSESLIVLAIKPSTHKNGSRFPWCRATFCVTPKRGLWL